jgi:hypothetical protein
MLGPGRLAGAKSWLNMKKLTLFLFIAALLQVATFSADIVIRRLQGDAVQPLVNPEVDLASASTTTLNNVNSQSIRITGTTPITSFGAATAGTFKRGRFAGALTLTHSSNLILPGAANFTTAANDRWEAWCLTSGTWIVCIWKADGTAIAGGAGSGDVTAASTFGTDNVLVRSDGTGKGVKSSLVAVDDSGNVSTPGTVTTGTSGAGTVGIGSAGVLLSTANNGDLTITGNGSGTDEAINVNLNSANVGTISSSTGLTNFVFSSIDLVVPTEVYSATDWNGDNTVPTKDAVRDKIESLSAGGGLGYTLKFGGSDTSANPASGGFTYHLGSVIFGPASTTFNNHRVYIPKAGTIKVIHVRTRVDGTAGSTESVVHKISINGAAAVGTGVALTYAASTVGASTGESIAVAAGDYITVTFTTPTWATPPTVVYWDAQVYIE